MSGAAAEAMTSERWALIEPLFDAALDLAAEQRHAYVDAIREARPALGADVDFLLAEVDSDSSLFARAAAERFGLLLGEPPAPMPALLDGRFAIESELGRGGMSIVYAAHDREYDRRVAVKVLRPEIVVAIGVERFEHEISVLAKLQHPHIVPFFSAGTVNGLPYFTMPLIEGESLRTRLAGGGLPIADVLAILRDVSKALAFAHAHGVVHRDIKPDNVMLSGGAVLVTDFGIAKAVAESLKTADLLATMDSAMITQAGTLVGTPTYMSPEQALGDGTADHRADIYAVGCLAYELLSGAAPFGRRKPAEMVKAHIAEAPLPVQAVRADVPEELAVLVMRCLEKSPDARPQSAREMLQALEEVGTHQPGPAATAPRPRFAWRNLGVAVAVVLLVATALVWRSRQSVDPATVRFAVSIPANQRPAENHYGPPIALSPDGRDLVYLGRAEKGSQLYLRTLDEANTRPIAGTEGGDAPFFSPDGQWLGFWANAQIRKVPIAGGASTALTDVWWMYGATWVTNDLIMVGAHPAEDRLAKLSAAGGDLRPFPAARVGQLPISMTGGKLVLFRGDSGFISLVAPDDASATRLDVRGTPVGVLERWLVYVRGGGALMAVEMDVGRRRVSGVPVQVLGGTLVRAAAVAANGTLVFIRRSTTRRAVLVDISTGAAKPLTNEPRDLAFPVFSPSGRQIAFEMAAPKGRDIFTYDIALATFTRLTFDGSAERPSWAPDGKHVGFTRFESHVGAAAWIAADGSGTVEALLDSLSPDASGIREITFSPDARFAVMRDDAALTKRDLWLVPLKGASGNQGVATPLERTPFNELMPRVSPDGRSLAFVSDVSGSDEVYVRPFPGNGAHIQVSAGGGMEPVWSPDGRGLFYRSNGTFMLAALSAGSPPTVVARRTLFEDKYVASPMHPQYDVTRDGRRLLVLEPAEANGEEISVVLGWVRELRAQMATAKPVR